MSTGMEPQPGTLPPKRRIYSRCCVHECYSKSDGTMDVTFHRFPRDGDFVYIENDSGGKLRCDRRKLWIEKLKIANFKTYMMVCSRHFHPSDYFAPVVPVKTRYLKKNAVPSQNLPMTYPVIPLKNRPQERHVGDSTQPRVWKFTQMDEDFLNFFQYKFMGGSVRLRRKPGKLPHFFDCQGYAKKPVTPKPKHCIDEQERKMIISELLRGTESESSCDAPREGVVRGEQVVNSGPCRVDSLHCSSASPSVTVENDAASGDKEDQGSSKSPIWGQGTVWHVKVPVSKSEMSAPLQVYADANASRMAEDDEVEAIVADLDWKMERAPRALDLRAKQIVKQVPQTQPEREEDSRVGALCRICHEMRSSVKKMFVEHEPGKLLFEVINDIYALEINPDDGLAEYICEACYQNVLRFQRFKKTCHEGHVALTSIKGKLSKDKAKSMDNLCRLCVNHSELHRNVFRCVEKGVHLYRIINDLCCLNVSKWDGLPAWACSKCINEVLEFDKCKKLAQQGGGTPSDTRAAENGEDGMKGLPEEGRTTPFDEMESGDVQGGSDEELDDEVRDEMADEVSIDSFLETKLEEGEKLEWGDELVPVNENDRQLEEGNRLDWSLKSDPDEEKPEDSRAVPGLMPCGTPSQILSSGSDTVERINRTKGSHPCPYCGKMFNLRHHLTIHIRTHTGEKPYRCKFCRKPFASHSGLSVHIRIHTGYKPHQCGICGRRFTQSGTAREHAKIHSEERTHKCEKCGKAFVQRGSYLNHMRMHEKEQPVTCGDCGATLASLANYRKHHTLVHLKQRPYKCDVCAKEFGTSWAFRSHYRMHSGERPYECKICLMRFANPSGYKLHISKHESKSGAKESNVTPTTEAVPS